MKDTVASILADSLSWLIHLVKVSPRSWAVSWSLLCKMELKFLTNCQQRMETWQQSQRELGSGFSNPGWAFWWLHPWLTLACSPMSHSEPESLNSEFLSLRTQRLYVVLCSATQSCLTLCSLIDCSPLGSSAHEFSRQEHWSGLPFPLSEIVWDNKYLLF